MSYHYHTLRTLNRWTYEKHSINSKKYISITTIVCMLSHFGGVQPFATRQTPLSMGVSRQEYRSGFPCPPPGYLLGPGIKSISLMFPELAGKFFTTTAITAIVFLNVVLFLSWLHCKVCGFLVPDRGSNPCTFVKGKSHHWVFLNF